MGWLSRLRHTIVGSTADDEFDEEAGFHLEQRTEQNRRGGMTLPDARREARHRLGNVALAREQARDVDTLRWLADLGADLRYAVRTLLKAPVFTLAALSALALGIGANSAIFAVVNTVLLKPPPYPHPERLVTLGYTFQGARAPLSSPAKLGVWRQRATAFEDISAWRNRGVSLADGSAVEQVQGMQVTAGFFKIFGVRAARGRLFTAEEDRPGGEPVVVLGHGFWRRRFGSDPDIVGRSVSIDGGSVTVLGILEPNFDTTIFNASPDFWIPMRLDPNSTDHPPSLAAVARLQPGVSLEAAQAEARLVGQEFHRRFPDASGPNDTFWVAPFQEVMVGSVRSSLFVLAGAVSFVLLIACANVANLLLVRASVRQREIATRMAIGASRWRIIRQLLTESLLLSLVGGALGLALGMVGIRALLALAPGDIPRIGPDAAAVTADSLVLAFTLLVSMTTGLAFGVLPALHVSRGDVSHALTQAGGRFASGIRHRTTRSLLVVSEVGLTLVLLIGAALLVRTFVALRTVNRGFQPHQLLTMRLAGGGPREPTTAEVAQLVRTGVQRIVALPGVVSAAATCCLPLESDWRTSFFIVGRPRERASGVTVVSYRIVSSDYFDVLRIPVIQGRAFTDHDTGDTPAVVIVNRAMARQFWPTTNPLDDRLIAFPGLVPDDEPARQVVGIVGDVRDGMPLDRDERPTIYVPVAQLLDRENAGWPLAWVIRTRTPPHSIAAAIQDQLRQVGGGRAIAGVLSMDELAAQSTASTHFTMIVLAVFAGAALLLAAIGVYGVMAYAVQQRQHGIGVRVALGASRHQVRILVLGEGLKLVLLGVATGMASAFGLTSVLAAFLFGVTPHDRVVFLVAPLVLAIVALGAVWLPARRATLVDPMYWLRHD